MGITENDTLDAARKRDIDIECAAQAGPGQHHHHLYLHYAFGSMQVHPFDHHGAMK
ncbi:hypothetical protein [Duganella hordei]|uniref:hypothetical protein n=1 Tax=Duganella hordei TaxID=2865934 RepID=UPI0033427594